MPKWKQASEQKWACQMKPGFRVCVSLRRNSHNRWHTRPVCSDDIAGAFNICFSSNTRNLVPLGRCLSYAVSFKLACEFRSHSVCNKRIHRSSCVWLAVVFIFFIAASTCVVIRSLYVLVAWEYTLMLSWCSLLYVALSLTVSWAWCLNRFWQF